MGCGFLVEDDRRRRKWECKREREKIVGDREEFFFENRRIRFLYRPIEEKGEIELGPGQGLF